jgi:hypothetical protein
MPRAATITVEEDRSTAPSTLARVGSMIGQLLEEIHTGNLDAAAHARLHSTLAQALIEVRRAVDEELCRELNRLASPIDPRVLLSEPELRIRHAQLVGWIAGVLSAAEYDDDGLPVMS